MSQPNSIKITKKRSRNERIRERNKEKGQKKINEEKKHERKGETVPKENQDDKQH